MVDRKVVPFDEFYYQLKLMHLFLLHPVFKLNGLLEIVDYLTSKEKWYFSNEYKCFIPSFIHFTWASKNFFSFWSNYAIFSYILDRKCPNL
jgi:hypothetical protein